MHRRATEATLMPRRLQSIADARPGGAQVLSLTFAADSAEALDGDVGGR